MDGIKRFLGGLPFMMAADDAGGGADVEVIEKVEESADVETTEEAESLTEQAEDSNSDEPQGDEDSSDENADSLTQGEADDDSSSDDQDEKPDETKDDKSDETPGEIEPYEPFQVGEGVVLDENAQEHFTPVLRELEMDQVGGQKLVESFAKFREAEVDANIKAIEQQRHRDIDTIKNDDKMGGEGDEKTFERTMNEVNRTLSVGNGAQLNALMRQHGLDNNPVLVRFLSTVGKNFDEDVIVTTRNNGGGELSALDAAFPTTVDM